MAFPKVCKKMPFPMLNSSDDCQKFTHRKSKGGAVNGLPGITWASEYKPGESSDSQIRHEKWIREVNNNKTTDDAALRRSTCL